MELFTEIAINAACFVVGYVLATQRGRHVLDRAEHDIVKLERLLDEAHENFYAAIDYMKAKNWWAQAKALEAGKHRDAKDLTP